MQFFLVALLAYLHLEILEVHFTIKLSKDFVLMLASTMWNQIVHEAHL